MIQNGFPNDKCNLPVELRPYWNMRSQLAIDEADDMIVVGARVVIPKACRRDVLNNLIKMHQGSTKLRQRARLSVFWPQMDNEIDVAAWSCKSCMESLPSLPREPSQEHQAASRPFEQVHADLPTFNGRDFLILADQFSGFPHVVPFPNKNTSACKIVDATRTFFTNGPGAPVKFKQFLKDWGIASGFSSPYYPQSNGFAEAAIKSKKKLIAGSWTAGSFNDDKFGQSILIFRNALRSGGASPAEMVLGRPARDCLPAHRRYFAPEWQRNADVLEKRVRKRIEHYNRTAHPLPAFNVGDHVFIQHPLRKFWATPGIIGECGKNRYYLVKTPAGRLFRRNRRFLRRRIPVFPGQQGPCPTPPAQQQPSDLPPAQEHPADFPRSQELRNGT